MAYYGEDADLLAYVADKKALEAQFPLDAQRDLALADVTRRLRRDGLTDAEIALLGAEATTQLRDAENLLTLSIFFSGFVAPEFQVMAKNFRKQAAEAMEGMPAVDDDPGGEEHFSTMLGLG